MRTLAGLHSEMHRSTNNMKGFIFFALLIVGVYSSKFSLVLGRMYFFPFLKEYKVKIKCYVKFLFFILFRPTQRDTPEHQR